jgi:hypothetical protein
MMNSYTTDIDQFPKQQHQKKVFIIGEERFAETRRDINRKSLSPAPGAYETNGRWG